MAKNKVDKVSLKMLVVLVLTFITSSVCMAVEGIWTKKADKLTARYLLATCTLDGKIYAIGGAPAPQRGSRNVEVYDPLTNTWEKKADLLVARAGLGASVVNGKIYAIGGSSAGLPSVEEYDPATDTWIRRADMPTRRSFLSCSVVDGKIYAIGGAVDTDGPFFSTVEEYDPATDTWSRKSDLPEPRHLHTAGVVNDKIYVIAGSPRNWTASSAVFEYDPTNDSWTKKNDAPTVRSWLSPNASVVNGRIYVIGGDFGPPKANVEEYDPATDTWTTRADMPNPRGALSTTAINDRIYLIGGSTTIYDALSIVEEYYPNPLIVDFNGDGTVNIKEILQVIEFWNQHDLLCDIAPRPSGDGVIDDQDLELLMNYWQQSVDDPTLIAHWTLDEAEGDIAYDSAGLSDASVIGNPIWQPSAGQVNGAIQLDGLDDCLVTASPLNVADGPFSLLMWIKGGKPGQSIISESKGSDWLAIDQLSGYLMTDLKKPGRGVPLLSNAVVSDENWHKIGFVWDGSYRKLYVDGVLVAEDLQNELMINGNGINIGTGKEMTLGTFFSGLIDDMRIYIRAVKP